MKKNNVKLEEAIEYVNTMYHSKMNNNEEFTDLELASVRLLRERTLNKYEIERLNNDIKELLKENGNKEKVIIAQDNIINEALGIANERFNYYSNHKNNNEEHLEDWKNIFNILLRRDNK